SSSPSLFSKER
ncbi:hypothetical protein D018_4163B, partial [Vibrio parahaemolyticus VP2007-007]